MCYITEEAMLETIQSTNLRRKVREVLDKVRLEGKPLIVQTYDTPQAVLIPYKDYQAFQKWQELQKKKEVWLQELRKIAENVSERARLSDQEAEELIAEATQ